MELSKINQLSRTIVYYLVNPLQKLDKTRRIQTISWRTRFENATRALFTSNSAEHTLGGGLSDRTHLHDTCLQKQ